MTQRFQHQDVMEKGGDEGTGEGEAAVAQCQSDAKSLVAHGL